MPRSEARIFSSAWQDQDFLALSRSAQGTYFFLLSQPDLSYCGVIPLRLPRWASKAEGFSIDALRADLEELSDGPKPLIVIDENAGELLIRSLVRNDGVWKQPNLLKSARESAEMIESREIKTVILSELHRIPIEQSSSDLVKEVLAGFIADLEGVSDTRPTDPSANPSGKGSEEGSGNPSRKG